MKRLASNIVRVSVAAAVWVCGTAPGQVIDDFEGALAWNALPSDGVNATVRLEKDAGGGSALRVDYDFAKGMGFVVVRRELNLEVPESYRFSFRVRGEGPANNFEFKLVEAKGDGKGGFVPGDDVWWVNKRSYEWPGAWKRVAYRNRHVAFAWGPGGGKAPLRRVGAIEFAVAAAHGGKGTVWIDDLKVEKVVSAGDAPPVVSSAAPVERSGRVFGEVELCEGIKTVAGGSPVDLAFAEAREVGAVVFETDRACTAELSLSPDGRAWEPVRGAVALAAGRSYLRTPGAEARAIRAVLTAADGSPVATTIRVLGPTVGDDVNAFLEMIAAASPRGVFPRGLVKEATSWTVVGLPGAEQEALISADGAIEVSKGGFAVEPFVEIEEGGVRRLCTWATASPRQELVGALPTVVWTVPTSKGDLELAIEAAEFGTRGQPGVAMIYALRGTPRTAGPVRARLVLALRPMQALPPSQWLNVTGGWTPVRTIEAVRKGPDRGLVVNGRWPVWPYGVDGCTMRVGNGLSGTLGAEVGDGRGAPERERAADADGLAWGAIEMPWGSFGAGDSETYGLIAPLRAPLADEGRATWTALSKNLDPRGAGWNERVSRVRLTLPPSARAVEETWRSQQRLIMVNADGPSLQPGSRTYERAWIRDGASIGTAMCYTGHAEMMREFVDWYGGFQYESGKVPCVVDARGPDPVPENDSHGEYIHAVATVYRFTRDRAFLARHWPRVVRAAAYIDALVAERSTDEWRFGEGTFEEGGFRVPKKAAFGLVPASISHEGYSAKPMHSHWDGFWTLRGLKDAAFLAGEVGGAEPAVYLERAAAYRARMATSVVLARQETKASWMPGCVELGDFDATSTAVAVWPTEEWRAAGGIPASLFEATFERYWSYFNERRLGATEWKDYTPYEVRIIGAMVRMGETDARWLWRAHELNGWFLRDQRPLGWRQWGEVVYRDKSFAGFIGDYPHTWVGADYLNSVRSMFVDERVSEGGENELVLGLGISGAWLEEAADKGLGITGAPTWWGAVSYTVREEPGRLMRWRITPELRAGVSTLVLAAPDRAVSAKVVSGPSAVKGVNGRLVRLEGPFTGVIEVEVRR